MHARTRALISVILVCTRVHMYASRGHLWDRDTIIERLVTFFIF